MHLLHRIYHIRSSYLSRLCSHPLHQVAKSARGTLIARPGDGLNPPNGILGLSIGGGMFCLVGGCWVDGRWVVGGRLFGRSAGGRRLMVVRLVVVGLVVVGLVVVGLAAVGVVVGLLVVGCCGGWLAGCWSLMGRSLEWGRETVVLRLIGWGICWIVGGRWAGGGWLLWGLVDWLLVVDWPFIGVGKGNRRPGLIGWGICWLVGGRWVGGGWL